ncbi:MAG: T9SS type A sorting domain-containing protein [Chitinophagales bacterium]|jgi:hypothetical protein|nr:T9SS type A sorting domain-containing protein [Sphingobacteriales bacterium]
MKQKLLLSALLCSSVQILLGQNGTRPDEAKVILGSQVVRTINVVANDNGTPGKTYTLLNVYPAVTSIGNITVNTVGGNATFQANHNGSQNDTFFYRAQDNLGAIDTNYVVVRKDALSLDQYPGDANKDNLCNHIDILNIGIAYGKSEIMREGIYFNNNWVLVKAYDWTLTNVKSNYRYSDANGDGTVDSAGDVGTIVKNYNRSTGFVNVHYSPTGGESFQLLSPDTVKTESSTGNFTVKINLGSNAAKIKKAYGLAFTVKYDPLQIKPNNIIFKASKWFSDNETTLNFSQINPNTGEVDITLVRTTGNGADGLGELGVIDVVIEDILQGIDLNFEITKPVLIDSVYNVLPVTIPTPKPVHIVKKSSSQINSTTKNSGLRYYVNDQKLSLKNENTKPLEVSIVNILGKEVSKKMLAPNQLIETETNLWSSGIYFLRTANEAYKIFVK